MSDSTGFYPLRVTEYEHGPRFLPATFTLILRPTHNVNGEPLAFDNFIPYDAENPPPAWVLNLTPCSGNTP